MTHKKIDLHLHSNFSDGTATPNEILGKAKNIGLETISITDHDTLEGLKNMLQLDLTDINLIPGVEISCEAGGYSYHILAYDFEIDKLQEIVSKGNQLGRQKIIDMIEWLASDRDIHLNKDDVDALLRKESPRKPDLAKLIVAQGYEENLEDAIHNILNNFPADKTYKLNVREVADAIHDAEGIAIWAHPLRGKGNIIFSEEEFLKRYENIKEDVDGIEVFYSLFGKKEYTFLEQFANENGLLISAGSDFHGEHKSVLLAQLNKENERIDFSRITILSKLL